MPRGGLKIKNCATIMVGFRTPDDIVYLADCQSSRETLDKYQIGFIYDATYLTTLEIVISLRAKMFVPAHAAVSEDVAELAQHNINKVTEIADKIIRICHEPLCFEMTLQKLFVDYGLIRFFTNMFWWAALFAPIWRG